MARVPIVVTTCDRHGGEIPDGEQYLHMSATAGGKVRGRKARQTFDLCKDCSKDFFKFLEGPEQGLTANQRIAEGMI